MFLSPRKFSLRTYIAQQMKAGGTKKEQSQPRFGTRWRPTYVITSRSRAVLHALRNYSVTRVVTVFSTLYCNNIENETKSEWHFLALRQWYLKVYRYLKKMKQIERRKKKKEKESSPTVVKCQVGEEKNRQRTAYSVKRK